MLYRFRSACKIPNASCEYYKTTYKTLKKDGNLLALLITGELFTEGGNFGISSSLTSNEGSYATELEVDFFFTCLVSPFVSVTENSTIIL